MSSSRFVLLFNRFTKTRTFDEFILVDIDLLKVYPY